MNRKMMGITLLTAGLIAIVEPLVVKDWSTTLLLVGIALCALGTWLVRTPARRQSSS